jgi:hypothetical protein
VRSGFYVEPCQNFNGCSQEPPQASDGSAGERYTRRTSYELVKGEGGGDPPHDSYPDVGGGLMRLLDLKNNSRG